MKLFACALMTFSFAGCDYVPEPAETPDEFAEPAPTRDDFAPLDGVLVEVPAADQVDPMLPFLVSRFGPTLGVPGTRVTILTAFDAYRCGPLGTCSVSVGGAVAAIDEDSHTLDIVVPDGATSGPICVTWRERTECADVFTVLTAPLLYSVDYGARGPGSDGHLDVWGAGFLEDSLVSLDGQPLATTFLADHHLSAVVPATLLGSSDAHGIQVYSPSTGRCGAWSEPLSMTLE